MEVGFEPMSRAFARDPYSVYARLRAHDAPFFFKGFDGLLLSRHADVEAAAVNPAMVRSMEAFMEPDAIAAERRRMGWHDMPSHERLIQFSLLDSDGDTHRRLRMLVMREFTASFVERHRAMIQTHVDALLDPLMYARKFDFIADFAAHVPGRVIGAVLGVPDEDCPKLRRWSEDVVQFFDVERTAAHKALAERATEEFHQYLLGLIAERTRCPSEDVITSLIAARAAGKMDETELISTCMLILMAGHGSTIDVLGGGMNALLDHPDQMARLRAEPGLIRTAVHEMFRFESPLPFFHRYAAEEVEVMGRAWPKGTKFGLLYGSANRDGAAFPDADVFNVGREPNRHIAFGRGAHLCLGNHLARLDMEVVFLTLLRRTRSIARVGGPPEFKRGLSVRGPVALPVRLEPA
jgi:cytochrome P450